MFQTYNEAIFIIVFLRNLQIVGIFTFNKAVQQRGRQNIYMSFVKIHFCFQWWKNM